MRKAFTMIELIFVISLVSILASVVIPKLMLSKDKAKASLCANEIGKLLQEIDVSYISVGYLRFKVLAIKDITNISTNVGNKKTGIFESNNTTIDSIGVTYYCDGEAIVKIRGSRVGKNYQLSIEDKVPVSVVGSKVRQNLISSNIISNNGIKFYKL